MKKFNNYDDVDDNLTQCLPFSIYFAYLHLFCLHIMKLWNCTWVLFVYMNFILKNPIIVKTTFIYNDNEVRKPILCFRASEFALSLKIHSSMYTFFG